MRRRLRRTFIAAFVLAITGCHPQEDPSPTLEDQAAQLLILGFRGKTIDDAQVITESLGRHKLGGVILFDRDVELGTDRNIESPAQVRSLIAGLQRQAGSPRLLVAIDQEGGFVDRLKSRYGFPQTHSAKYFGDLGDPAATYAEADVTTATLADLGINLNFAPVVDLDVNPSSPAIGARERSYSADPAVVIEHATQVIEAHREHGVATALKHFPGHGSATADSHVGFVDVSSTWSDVELEPFVALAGPDPLQLVMTAHLYNSRFDPNYPATLSAATIGVLREHIGFRGVVVSDDMQMGAITQYYGLERALELSINAGVDLFIFANNLVYEPDVADRAVVAIVQMVEDGRIPRQKLRAAYDRVCGLKVALKLAC
ncbi:glycoside hydrolase family 3 protein [Peristeroidobacter soli]|uniref:glycoside hydrolase family 3 protein n=1 Tax=Peristeroidobacter soli TaxID=2497877 RepID=UPI0013005DB2|nr:glycoside hydrolase family 3 N-terminal domain-containing protein [Peristeroidobacter soli]